MRLSAVLRVIRLGKLIRGTRGGLDAKQERYRDLVDQMQNIYGSKEACSVGQIKEYWDYAKEFFQSPRSVLSIEQFKAVDGLCCRQDDPMSCMSYAKLLWFIQRDWKNPGRWPKDFTKSVQWLLDQHLADQHGTRFVSVSSVLNIDVGAADMPGEEIVKLLAAKASSENIPPQDNDSPFSPPPTPEEKPMPAQSTEELPQDLGSLNLQELLSHVQKVPELVDQIKQAREKEKQALSQVLDRSKERDEAVKTATDLVAKLKEAKQEVASRDTKIRELLSRPAVTVDVDAVPQGNDLSAIAAAMNIERKQLEDNIAAFRASCIDKRNVPVRWPKWCDISDNTSLLPDIYDSDQHAILSGPSGTGKTFIAERLCVQRSGMVCSLSLHKDTRYSQLFCKTLVRGGETYTQLGAVVMCALAGVPLILDEIDHADVFIQSLSHYLLDNDQIFVPELNMVINTEEGFKLLATCNSMTDAVGEYHGEIGTALRTRFAAVYVGYPDRIAEAETIQVAAGLDQAPSHRIATVFRACRTAEKEHGTIEGPFSVRESVNAGKTAKRLIDKGCKEDIALAQALYIWLVAKRPSDQHASVQEVIAQHEGIGDNLNHLLNEMENN